MNRLAVIAVVAGYLTIGSQGEAKEREVVYPPFPAQEYAAFTNGGSGSVSGQAFLRTVNGSIKTAAGFQVTLDPKTHYSRLWWNEQGTNWKRKREVPPDAGFVAARKVTRADAEGKFSFEGLAAGTYYLRSVVTWTAPRIGMQGGLVVAEVVVREGEKTEVMLTEIPEYGAPFGFKEKFDTALE